MSEDEGIPTAAYLYRSQTPVGVVDAALPGDPREVETEDPVDDEVEELVRRQDIIDLIEELRQKKVEKPEQAKSIHFNIGFGSALDKLKEEVEQSE